MCSFKQTEKTHNKSFTAEALGQVAHQVTIVAGTHLSQLILPEYPGYNEENNPTVDSVTIDVNSSHWAQAQFSVDSQITQTAYDDDVVEGFEDPSVHFCIGVQWHPEYAQLGLLDGEDLNYSEPHIYLIQSFLKASTARHAAVIIQRAFRDRVDLP